MSSNSSTPEKSTLEEKVDICDNLPSNVEYLPLEDKMDICDDDLFNFFFLEDAFL